VSRLGGGVFVGLVLVVVGWGWGWWGFFGVGFCGGVVVVVVVFGGLLGVVGGLGWFFLGGCVVVVGGVLWGLACGLLVCEGSDPWSWVASCGWFLGRGWAILIVARRLSGVVVLCGCLQWGCWVGGGVLGSPVGGASRVLLSLLGGRVVWRGGLGRLCSAVGSR